MTRCCIPQSSSECQRLARSIGFCALLVASALGSQACSGKSSRGCQANSECATGQSCNLLSGQCIRTFQEFKGKELEFQGQVTCKVDPPDEPSLVASSDVVGRLGGKVLPLIELPGCSVEGGTLNIQVMGSRPPDEDTPSRQFMLVAYVPVDALQSGGSVNVTPEPLEDVVATGNAFVALMEFDEHDDTLDYVAFSEAGSVRIERGAPKLGQTLEVEIDVELAALTQSQLGSACVEPYECDLNQSLLCTMMGCSTICHAQEDCAESGGICTSLYEDSVGSFCLAPCQTDADCDPTFHCANFVAEQGVCTPLDVPGPADEGSFGARCAGNEDCVGSLVCANFGGEQGACTQTCGDVCLAVGMVAHCLALDAETSLCARACSEHKDCPDDLVCADAGGVLACVPPEITE